MSGPFPSGHKFLNTDLNPAILGWIDFLAWYGTTLAYVSADAPTFTFSINADVTGVIEPGMRIKLTQTTDKFFIVTAVGVFAAGVTPITVYGGTDYTLLNAAITAGSFSTHKKPFGFNVSPAKWTETLKDTSDRSQASPVSGTWYNLGSLSISIPIGIWNVTYGAVLELSRASAATLRASVTLSTANNSESDSELTSWAEGNSTVVGGFAGRPKTIPLASKTPYFFNAKGNDSTASALTAVGSQAPTIVRAVCAYL